MHILLFLLITWTGVVNADAVSDSYDEIAREPKNFMQMTRKGKFVKQSLELVELKFMSDKIAWSQSKCSGKMCYHGVEEFLATAEGQTSLAKKQWAIKKIKEMGQRAVVAISQQIEELQTTPECIINDSWVVQYQTIHKIISPFKISEETFLTKVKENLVPYVKKNGIPGFVAELYKQSNVICRVEKKIDPISFKEFCYNKKNKTSINCLDFKLRNILSVVI